MKFPQGEVVPLARYREFRCQSLNCLVSNVGRMPSSERDPQVRALSPPTPAAAPLSGSTPTPAALEGTPSPAPRHTIVRLPRRSSPDQWASPRTTAPPPTAPAPRYTELPAP